MCLIPTEEDILRELKDSTFIAKYTEGRLVWSSSGGGITACAASLIETKNAELTALREKCAELQRRNDILREFADQLQSERDEAAKQDASQKNDGRSDEEIARDGAQFVMGDERNSAAKPEGKEVK